MINKISLAKIGEKNPMWKGEKAGYLAIHEFVHRRIKKPKWCQRCRKRPAIDLANISQNYKRELSDWIYLCRRCHMSEDGRSIKLSQYGKNAKKPAKKCLRCRKPFHRSTRMENSKFCSQRCYQLAGGRGNKY